MRRCFIPGIIALGLHGLLFAMEFKWPAGESFFHIKTTAITISLNYFQTEKPKPDSAIPKPAPAPRKTVKKVKSTVSQPRPAPKPKPDVVPLPAPKADLSAKKNLASPPQLEPIETRAEKAPAQKPVEIPEELAPVAPITGALAQPKVAPAAVVRKAKPLYRRNPPPRYPRLARKRKYQGVVILEVFVNRDGSVGDTKIFKSSGYAILDKTAMKALKKWEFEPGRRGNDQLEMWVRVPVRFQLK